MYIHIYAHTYICICTHTYVFKTSIYSYVALIHGICKILAHASNFGRVATVLVPKTIVFFETYIQDGQRAGFLLHGEIEFFQANFCVKNLAIRLPESSKGLTEPPHPIVTVSFILSFFVSSFGGEYPTKSLDEVSGEDAIIRIEPQRLFRTVADLVYGRLAEWVKTV